MAVYWCDNCRVPIINPEKSDDSIKNQYIDVEDEILEHFQDKDDSETEYLYNKYKSLKKKVNNAIKNKNEISLYRKFNSNIKNKELDEDMAFLYRKIKLYLLIKLYRGNPEQRKKARNLDEDIYRRIEDRKSSKNTLNCRVCSSKLKYMGKDIRPVFIEEKIMLEELLGINLIGENVWAGKSHRYFLNGEVASFSKSDLYDLSEAKIEKKRQVIFDRIKGHKEDINKEFSKFIKRNKSHLKFIEDNAFNFIKNARDIFSDSFQIVSFSGGKDSTVTSNLVRRALKNHDIMHVFGDTTLEFPTTYKYLSNFKNKSISPPFMTAKNTETVDESKFFNLSERFGPPSRVISWCCTIFKTGPIGDFFRNVADNGEVFTYYGIRREESNSRRNYDKISRSPKISGQIVASPIIDWKDIDIWLYLLSHNLDFNKAYKYGFTRVGCLYCPNNSKWSEFLIKIFMPSKNKKWLDFLVDFAERIGKPDPEEYIKNGKWKARQGGSGLEEEVKSSTIIEAKPCGLGDNARSYELQKPITEELYELFKPFGEIDKNSGNNLLNEVYVRGYNGENVFVLQGKKGQKNLKINFLKAKNMKLLQQRVACQLRKYQSCISCGACANICPQDAINTRGTYKIDKNECNHCMNCIAAFHKGCLLAKTTMDY